MDIRFVHIGLMKTATSYFQAIWRNDPRYRLIHKDANRMVQYVRESTPRSVFDSKKEFSLKLDDQPESSGDVVISSEGFSCAFMNDNYYNYIYDYIDNASCLLGNVSHLTNTVVVTVRNPVRWLSSMHSQFVNQGGSGSFKEFYRSKPDFLSSCLDLEFIIDCYRRFFGNVVVIPYEYLVDDESYFWEYVREETGAPLPSIKGPKINESVSDERLIVMAELNNINNVMRESLKTSNTYKDKERDQLVAQSEAKDKWFNRRFCQFSNDEEFFEVSEKLSGKPTVGDFKEVSIPERDAQKIEQRFINVVASMTGDDALSDRYLIELNRIVES